VEWHNKQLTIKKQGAADLPTTCGSGAHRFSIISHSVPQVDHKLSSPRSIHSSTSTAATLSHRACIYILSLADTFTGEEKFNRFFVNIDQQIPVVDVTAFTF
jgi:hypothetical protein